MPSTPVDDHTEEFEQLAGLVALDVLEGDELARFEQHAARCGRCRLMVQLDREALARAAPEMDPSPGFKERLMARAAQELQPAPNLIPLWRRRSRLTSAIAAVLVMALVGAGAFSYENQVIATYSLTGSVGGTAIVQVRRSGAAELDLRGVQPPPPGFLYEAWVIPQGGEPVPAGVTPTGEAQLPLSGVSSGSTVAITQERTRVDAPTSAPVLATVVQL